MKRRHLVTFGALAAAALVLLALSACDDVTSSTDEARPAMANIWPHDDGMRWRFSITLDQYEGVPAEAAPPALPLFEELHAALAQPVAYTRVDGGTGSYVLKLDGQTTTDSGVTAQNMVGTITTTTDGKARPAATAHDQLLRALAAARPGNAALAAAAAGAKALTGARNPSFLGTMAFAYEDSGYYSYGDFNHDHAWIELEGDLTEGSTFALQLMPALVDDVWLYGRIWSVRDRLIGGRRWDNVVECMYVVDLGTQAYTDEGGAVLGYTRAYWYGTVLYVPDVGPIACDERHVWGPSNSIMGAQPGGMDVYHLQYAPSGS